MSEAATISAATPAAADQPRFLGLRISPLNARRLVNFRRNRRNQHQGAIMVIGSTTNMRDMRRIDAWMDDGNNNTGIIQIRSGGARVFYMLEN